MHAKKHSSNFTNFSKRLLSFKTQFNVEFLLPVTGSRKVLGIIPATIGIATTISFTSRKCWILFGCFHIFFISFLIINPQLLLIFSDTVYQTLHNESKHSESFEKEKYIISAQKTKFSIEDFFTSFFVQCMTSLTKSIKWNVQED